MPRIRYLKIQFSNTLQAWELPAFRAAVIEKTKRQSVLFHNHEDNGYRYAYPLIQYKVNNRKACVVCINAGTDDIHYLIGLRKLSLRIGDREDVFKIEDIHIKYHQVQIWNSCFDFSVRNWNALNQENFKSYVAIVEAGGDPRLFLSRILIGNIISFAKGIGWNVEHEVKVEILRISDEKWIPYKGINLLALSMDFTCNVSLPSWIGLGKGTAVGFGTIRRRLKTYEDVGEGRYESE